ncbi:MAG: C45 family autoproteolytic acyltransferase/hydrolase [Roseiflexaceae bacterium]
MIAVTRPAHEYAADYRVVALAGPPAAIGRAQAAYLRPVGAPFRRIPWEDDSAFLRACARVVAGFHAPLWEELAAFADALSLPAERALFVRAGALPHGCSAFAWVLDDGQVIAGRNYDFYERMPTRHLLITQPERGYAHVGMNGGLVGGRYDGVNEQGLFVALHKVMADRPRHTPPGVPFHLPPRLALETCATAHEAARLLAAMPHLASFDYTVADASGACFAVETYPGLPAQLRAGEAGVAVANHYESAALAPLQGQRSVAGSRARCVAMEQAPPPWEDPWDAAIALLSDHRSGMCCHREFGSTLWSAVFELSARRAAYAFGPPCRVAYREVAIPTS